MLKKMKKIAQYILILAVVLVSVSCTTGKKDTQKTANYAQKAMAVISIETVNMEDTVMDFVTKPVAAHVSQQIATWTPDYTVPPAPYYEDCTITVKDDTGEVLLEEVKAEVKVRGNWTTNYSKKPLRIKFNKKQSMLGLNEGAEFKNWVLLAGYKDTSFLRDKTAYQLADELLGAEGYYVTDAEFVEVYINGEYWGVYLLAEQQEIKKGRVDITEADDDYTGTDIGYFLEMDGYYYTESELQRFEVNYTGWASIKAYDGNKGRSTRGTSVNKGFTIKSDIYSPEQRDFIANYMNRIYEIMYYAAYEDKAYVFNPDFTSISETKDITPREAVERVVDVKSLALTYILNEIACDADIYWSSFLMSVDFGKDGARKLTFEAPWDFDSAFGNKDRAADGKGFYAANSMMDVNNRYSSFNPWLAVLMHEDWYMDIIRQEWTEAYDSLMFDRVFEMIEKDTSQYSEAFDRNYKRWNNLIDKSAFQDELTAKSKAVKTHGEASMLLSQWLKTRVEFLNSKFHL